MKAPYLIGSLVSFIMITTFFSCRTIPDGATAVEPFEKERYLGKWYEVARLDNRFERNMNNVTAEYSLNDDGTIKVVNRGYDTLKGQWEQATGKAKVAGNDNVGMLKVSFFGPFYSGYNVIAIDEDYQYALVAGNSLKYLWILSRRTSIPEEIKSEYLKIAEDIGYKTEDLLWITHHRKREG